jgi:hypothetical protein
LNVAQNKIEKLPPAGDHTAHVSPSRKTKTGRGTAMPDRLGYTAPILEEVYLQVCEILSFAVTEFQNCSLLECDVL